MDLGNTQKVQRIRHEGLEARVLYTGDLFGAGEVPFGRVATLLSLARVVHQVLRHLPQGPALLAVIDDHAASAALGRSDAFFDGMRQVGSAGADITAEHVAAVAFVVHAAR